MSETYDDEVENRGNDFRRDLIGVLQREPVHVEYDHTAEYLGPRFQDSQLQRGQGRFEYFAHIEFAGVPVTCRQNTGLDINIYIFILLNYYFLKKKLFVRYLCSPMSIVFTTNYEQISEEFFFFFGRNSSAAKVILWEFEKF